MLSADQIFERYCFLPDTIVSIIRQLERVKDSLRCADAPLKVAATGAEGASRSEFLCHRDVSNYTGRHREDTQIHCVAVYPTGDTRFD